MKHTNPDGTEFDFTRVPVQKLATTLTHGRRAAGVAAA